MSSFVLIVICLLSLLNLGAVAEAFFPTVRRKLLTSRTTLVPGQSYKLDTDKVVRVLHVNICRTHAKLIHEIPNKGKFCAYQINGDSELYVLDMATARAKFRDLTEGSPNA